MSSSWTSTSAVCSENHVHLGKSGKYDRLALYCPDHAYDKHERHPITDAILERAHAEGWPFMQWPPVPPEEKALHELRAALGALECALEAADENDHEVVAGIRFSIACVAGFIEGVGASADLELKVREKS